MKSTHVILAVNMKKTIKPLAYFAVIIVIILSFLSLSRAVSASHAPFAQIDPTATPLTTNTTSPTAAIDPDTIGDTSGVILVGIIIVLIILAGIIWGGVVYRREFNDHN